MKRIFLPLLTLVILTGCYNYKDEGENAKAELLNGNTNNAKKIINKFCSKETTNLSDIIDFCEPLKNNKIDFYDCLYEKIEQADETDNVELNLRAMKLYFEKDIFNGYYVCRKNAGKKFAERVLKADPNNFDANYCLGTYLLQENYFSQQEVTMHFMKIINQLNQKQKKDLILLMKDHIIEFKTQHNMEETLKEINSCLNVAKSLNIDWKI